MKIWFIREAKNVQIILALDKPVFLQNNLP